MWPRLVPPRACRTLCAITLTDGTSEGGAPNVVATMELPCNWQDKPRQIMDVEKHLIQLSGTALFDGDIAPEVDILAGTVEIYGKSWIIYRGGKCKAPSEEDLRAYAYVLAEGIKRRKAREAAEAEQESKVAAALEALGPCPEYPEDVATILNAGRWNGKVYGRKGGWSVYVSGNKQALTDVQKEALEATQEARAEWRAKKAAAEAEARA